MTLEGRVAAIVSVREVAINLGGKDGVEAGMIFAILSETPLHVKDPETGKALGEIDRVKVRVQVEEIHFKFSICRTYEVDPSPFLSAYLRGVASSLSQLESRPRTLKVEDSELPPPLPEEESYVKVGDRVRLIGGAEQESTGEGDE